MSPERDYDGNGDFREGDLVGQDGMVFPEQVDQFVAKRFLVYASLWVGWGGSDDVFEIEGFERGSLWIRGPELDRVEDLEQER